MTKKISRKAPLFMAACMAFALVLAGCDNSSSPTRIYHTVTFNTHDGSAVAAQSVRDGETATRPANPTRSGFTFTNWYTAQTGGSAFNFATPITGDTTVHAQWHSNRFTFGEVTTPLRFAAFSTYYLGGDPTEGIWGFGFLLQASETMGNWVNTIYLSIPVGLMDSEIDDLSVTSKGWSLVFNHTDNYPPAIDYWSHPDGTLPAAGTMRVDRTSTNRFRITIDIDDSTPPFSVRFYGEFEPKHSDAIRPPWWT